MVHCGYEPTAVTETFGSLRGLWGAARTMLFGSSGRHKPSKPLPSLSSVLPIVNAGPTGCGNRCSEPMVNLRGHSPPSICG